MRSPQWRAREPLMAAALWLMVAAGVGALAIALPPRTFFVGDPGVKLIVARNAIEHPGRPLEVTLPSIAGRPSSLVDPFFRVHGDHAHATTSELFPLASAPLIALWGVRGAFVLPAIGFLLAVGAMAWLGMELDPRRSPIALVLVGAVWTPLMFYGLEFWEHAPGVGVGALATVLLARKERSGAGLLVSGGLLGIAVLLRPEAAWYGAAVLVGMQISSGPTGPAGLKAALTVCCGVALIAVPWVAYTFVHSGQLLGPHVGANLPTVLINWPATRLAIAREWLGAPTLPATISLLAVLVCAVIANRDAGRGSSGGAWIVFLVAVATVAVEAALQVFPRENLWAAAPAALLALATPPGEERKGRGFLASTLIVYAALVLLTAPNDGGGQWGPRYLLFGCAPLTVLMADALTTAAFWRRVAPVTVAVVLAASLWIDRSAYRDLRRAKRAYENVVQLVERESAPDGYVLTDLWWLDQVVAALYPRPVILFTDTTTDARTALRALSDAGVGAVTIVRSAAESGKDPIASWLDASLFRVAAQRDISERSLTAYRLVRAGPPS